MTLESLPFGYKFDHPQLDGTYAISFKAAYHPLRAMRILQLAEQQGLQGIMVETGGRGTKLGFITRDFTDPLPQFFAQQSLVTQINREAARKAPDLHLLAGKIRELFRWNGM